MCLQFMTFSLTTGRSAGRSTARNSGGQTVHCSRYFCLSCKWISICDEICGRALSPIYPMHLC